jgi:hypothetical protein
MNFTCTIASKAPISTTTTMEKSTVQLLKEERDSIIQQLDVMCQASRDVKTGYNILSATRMTRALLARRDAIGKHDKHALIEMILISSLQLEQTTIEDTSQRMSDALELFAICSEACIVGID